MPRLIALYSEPEDRAAFDRHYAEVHAPLIQRYPHLRELRTTRVAGAGGRSSPYYLMAEMLFETREQLDEALRSDPGIESGRDLRNFAAAGVTLFIADE